jgi:hypothetical protein
MTWVRMVGVLLAFALVLYRTGVAVPAIFSRRPVAAASPPRRDWPSAAGR